MEKRTYDADEIMFTSDTHFGHENIIRFCKRPYRDAHHMDERLVANWNEAVRPDQVVIHTGDFGFKAGQTKLVGLVARLNGRIILVQGNHDTRESLPLFSEVHDLLEINVKKADGEKQMIIACHYRMVVWPRSHHGSWHIHGHSHGTLPIVTDRPVLDIGVDSWAMQPIDFATVALGMRRSMV